MQNITVEKRQTDPMRTSYFFQYKDAYWNLTVNTIKSFIKIKNTIWIGYNAKKIPSATYYGFWNIIMEGHKMQHTPHECRHTFMSRLDSGGANKKCIVMMMGHKSKDVTERVYTHKTLDELREAINLITN